MGRRGRRPAQPSENKRTQSDSDGEQSVPSKVSKIVVGPQQCYGPGCTNQNRPNSKYCSNECGRRLATNRIFQVQDMVLSFPIM